MIFTGRSSVADCRWGYQSSCTPLLHSPPLCTFILHIIHRKGLYSALSVCLFQKRLSLNSRRFFKLHYNLICAQDGDEGYAEVCGGPRTACKSWFAPSTVWVPGSNPGLQDWGPTPFPTELTHGPLLLFLGVEGTLDLQHLTVTHLASQEPACSKLGASPSPFVF